MQIRLYSPQTLILNSKTLLKGNQYHYLVRVMRIKPSDILCLFNPKDGEFEAKIIDLQKNHLEIELVKFITPPSLEQELTLYFSPIKNPNASFIVQKATELGATRIQPIITKYTVVNKINLDKLELVAIEAAEQCERFSVPKIFPLLKLEDALKSRHHKGPLIFCNENEAKQFLGDYLLEKKPKDIGILIGPEGGFSSAEAAMIINQKGISVHLGERILRAETAIIATLSIYQAVAGEWNRSA